MKVIKCQSKGHAAIVEAPKPKLRPDYILVKVSAVALNPTDWKHVHLGLAAPGCTIGCDYAGVVEEVGSAVTKPFKKGDRIAGFVHGGNSVQPEDGGFGEYLVAKGDIQFKIPDGTSDEEAATLGVGIVTVGQGLYQSLGLPLPDNPSKEEFPVLIYGGSTATGAMGIQWLKLSGLNPIATCSPRNFDYVKSLGASAVFDYNSPTCGADIRAYTHNKLYYAWDCFSEKRSPEICCEALSSDTSSKAPQYGAILFVKDLPRSDVEVKETLGYTAVGEFFRFGDSEWPAKPEDFEYAKKMFGLTEELLAQKKFKPHRPDVRPGGLEGVLEGMEDLRQNRVSGVKLVYRIGK